MTSIKENLQVIREKITAAASSVGKNYSDITLLAVSKTFGADVVNEAIKAGVTAIGENRVQEAAAKFPLLPGEVEKHFIGPLQTNKVNKAVQLFDWIQSLDSVRLARKLDQAAKREDLVINVLVEVKLEDEPAKHGVAYQDLQPFLEEIGSLDNLAVQGLMAIPPYSADPEVVRPYFKRLRQLYVVAQNWGGNNVKMRYLSMGMSHDFIVAIEEGANLVRLGTAIFGAR